MTPIKLNFFEVIKNGTQEIRDRVLEEDLSVDSTGALFLLTTMNNIVERLRLLISDDDVLIEIYKKDE